MSLTNQILEFLSGNVPGGVFPYLFFISLVDLILYVLGKHSEFVDWKKFKRRIKIFTSFAVTIYVMLWFGFAPETVSSRFIIFPTVAKKDKDKMALPLYVDQNFKKEIQKNSFYHPAKWIVNSADHDSLFNIDYQKLLAMRMDAELYLLSWYDKGEYHWEIRDKESHSPILSGHDKDLIPWLKSLSNSLNRYFDVNKVATIPAQFDQISLLYWWKSVDSTQNIIEFYETSDSTFQNNVSAEIAYSYAMIHQAYDEKKRQKLILNPFKKSDRYKNWFIKGRERMIREGMKNPDNLDINLVLGEAYILEENFYKAEIALKNAVASDQYDADVYFLLSFLSPSRYQDLGFENINGLLNKAILYDPMYEEAVTRYVEKIGKESVVADHYFFELTTHICKNFLRIKPSSYGIWNDLAGLYLIGNYFDKAMQASEEAFKYAPHNEGVLFNAGIIRYRTNNFEGALPYFDELIARYNHLDARLYRGMIYRKKGMYKEAVLDFRYRILNKISDEDRYAREAVKGVRRIRKELAKKGINLDDIVQPYRIKK